MAAEQRLIDALLERASDDKGKRKINCAEAFDLARQFQVKVIEIGRICDQHDIRICNCQLGCFK